MKLICVGKNREKALLALEKEYLKRLSAFEKLEVIEVKDEPNLHTEREAEVKTVKDKEAARILDKIRENDFVILLDLHGQMLDSVEFSRKLMNWRTRGNVVFVIAGSLGPGQALYDRANARWKLSDLTFTHMMCRPLVLEQIYRAFMIENNRSYHK